MGYGCNLGHDHLLADAIELGVTNQDVAIGMANQGVLFCRHRAVEHACAAADAHRCHGHWRPEGLC